MAGMIGSEKHTCLPDHLYLDVCLTTAFQVCGGRRGHPRACQLSPPSYLRLLSFTSSAFLNFSTTSRISLFFFSLLFFIINPLFIFSLDSQIFYASRSSFYLQLFIIFPLLHNLRNLLISVAISALYLHTDPYLYIFSTASKIHHYSFISPPLYIQRFDHLLTQ